MKATCWRLTYVDFRIHGFFLGGVGRWGVSVGFKHGRGLWLFF
jgi:hypothetical protein